MNWIRIQLKKAKMENESQQRRSEEISDIIDRMPMAFGRWVVIAVIIFSGLLLLFGWIIKYPDTVIGQIKINSNNAPVKLVANSSGNIQLFVYKAQDDVKEGDYIAVIQNSAVIADVQKIAGLIRIFNPNKILFMKNQNLFPDKISLGDLDLKYYSFLSALKNRCDYEKGNVYEKQRIGLVEDIRWKETILKESQEMLEVTIQKLQISEKWFDKYTSLNKDEIVTYELEVDKSKNEYLVMKQEEQNLKKEIASINMQIVENRNKLNQLDVEQKEKERKLQLDLLASFHDLTDNIKAWEQKFVFKAPFNGKLEYLKFLADNQFIQAGEEVFGIIPKENKVFGQVLLPSSGAGKVKEGSRVTVKLDNYPYMEYGSVEGYVESISLISQTQRTEQNMLDLYLITVKLPNGLKTNYGEHLDFKYEIGGTADIIVKERRLIERLFDNLKYSIQ
ncbi:MAG: HlyD family secretion protein [Prevotella sp.]|jgi:multidrug resistance efflux pump|nr:HlyD family secretion protein [Prevotella sp.]